MLCAWALLPPRERAKPTRGWDRIPVRTSLSRPPSIRHQFTPTAVPARACAKIQRSPRWMAKVGKAFGNSSPNPHRVRRGRRGRARVAVTQFSGQAPDVIQINVEASGRTCQELVRPARQVSRPPNPSSRRGSGYERWWDVFKYTVPTRARRRRREMYCVVLDMIETGIYYNKNLFDRLGHATRDVGGVPHAPAAREGRRYTPMVVARMPRRLGRRFALRTTLRRPPDVLDLNYDPRRGEYLHATSTGRADLPPRPGFFTPRDPAGRRSGAS